MPTCENHPFQTKHARNLEMVGFPPHSQRPKFPHASNSRRRAALSSSLSDSIRPSPRQTETRGLCPAREFDASSTRAKRLPKRRFSSAENADFPLHRQGRPGAIWVRELLALFTLHETLVKL
ncbi:hypothetical protein TGME49_266368 [Toxoplasma gondii ME49]|uniref:Uncharacterized protein n=3 Tax=Toxoplasma gondii TaxID=5811 RepID=A0A2G8Y412_TOXGO|nr:hypothetical protein TGME49_266368 [Toxoplasma gondii ME49]EPT27666.1 hypothetical protein TGME49_266368 [Toxoplasma gondii ME49]KYF45499.1 hypothetical protein TGARI_266368 [Toxoplasma gondii ARI]PIM02016.1 hypothetical protein TGCOUG_266368 [Toxoplasma gondii COUG]|eukprot:XP_018636275.1 hypothetical protein TGME49_266368 [Toxoplasma gondii ME49]